MENIATRYHKNKPEWPLLEVHFLLPTCVYAQVILSDVYKQDFNSAVLLAHECYDNLNDRTQEVLEFGATKYGLHNWKKGMSYDMIVPSLIRHMYAYHTRDIAIDEESGLSHIGHIGANLMFLQYHSLKGFLPNEKTPLIQ